MDSSSPAPELALADLSRRVWAVVRRHGPIGLFLLLGFSIWAWVTWEAASLRTITWQGGADYWEHSAALHSLLENPWHPRHPHLSSDSGSPRFGPQFLVVALMARALHWNALEAMTLAASLNALLFVSGIYVFFRSYFRHPLAPLYGLLVMFGAWWFGWNFSNVYALPVFFNVASYPSTTALGLTLHGFGLAVRLLRGQVQRRWLAWSTLVLWAALVMIVHQLTVVLSISGVLLLAAVEPKVSLRRRFEIAGALALGCGLAAFWPYFSPFLVLRGGRGEAADWASESVQQAKELYSKPRLHMFYRTQGLTRALGLAWVTVLALPYFLLQRRRWFVSLGALSMLLPFLANMYIEVPLGHGFVLLAMVYLHVGLVWLALGLTPGHSSSFPLLRFRALGIVTSLLTFATLLLFFSHAVLHAYESQQPAKFEERESPLVVSSRAIAEAAGPNAIILASPRTSWPLPTFGPRVLVLLHPDPLVPDAGQREGLVGRFLRRSISDAERREILARYGVTHVLLGRREGRPAAEFLAANAKLRVINGYQLYALKPSARTPNQ